MNLELTIDEAVECFGKEMIAKIIQDGLHFRHNAEADIEVRKRYPGISWGGRREYREVNKLNLRIEGANYPRKPKKKVKQGKMLTERELLKELKKTLEITNSKELKETLGITNLDVPKRIDW